MKAKIYFSILTAACLFLVLLQLNCAPEKKTMTQEELVARGKYLVEIGGCNDCHSPKIMTAMGPVPDTTKLLSGHPSSQPMMPFDPDLTKPGKWVLADDGTTMWAGPWGVSFTANLTPDSSTGLGAWTLENFINTLRSGKHLGTGRNLLPPMPWQGIGKMTNEDLKALYTYLRSIPAVHNRVPNPIPPNMVMNNMMKK